MQPVERPTRPAKIEESTFNAFDPYATEAEITAFEGINIEWKDGLPADRTEDVANEVALRSVRLSSLYSAIKRLNGGDEDATQKELDRLEEENQKSQEDQLALQAAGQVPGGEGEMDSTTALVGSMRVNKDSGAKAKEKAKETGQDEKTK